MIFFYLIIIFCVGLGGKEWEGRNLLHHIIDGTSLTLFYFLFFLFLLGTFLLVWNMVDSLS